MCSLAEDVGNLCQMPDLCRESPVLRKEKPGETPETLRFSKCQHISFGWLL